MTSPTGPDQNHPQGQPGYGASQPPAGSTSPGYGAPGYGPPGYGPPGYEQGNVPAPSYAAGPPPTAGVMPFPDAVRSVLTQYVTFTGRARRSEYWWFALFNFGVSLLAGVIDAVIGVALLQWVVTLGLLLPSLAVGVRRLHDTGRSGWWLLIGLVPLVGAIVLIVFFCTDSQREANRWGSSPKYQGAASY